MTVYIIGIGLGNPDTMTVQARKAIEGSDLLIGAPRMLENWKEKPCISAIASTDIVEKLREYNPETAAVLLSGDVGFYSGAKGLYPLLAGETVIPIPGLSSVQYLCAKCCVPWEDVCLISAHGRAHNAVGEIRCHRRSFVLTGGNYRAEALCRELTEAGLGDVTVTVGERLSYPEERLVTGSARSLMEEQFDSLSAVLVDNPHPLTREFQAPSLPDDAFTRGKVPMTKQEVRMTAVSLLHLRREDTVWDVGAGTGSVSVECALASCAGRVYAIERKDDAVALLEENKEKFGVTNLTVVPGLAPEALENLPAPDRVFIGGSGGNLQEILQICLHKNPNVRVVLTAVTVETLTEGLRCMDNLGFSPEVTQLAVTRTRKVGTYHMMDAQNPVWVLSGEVQHG